MAICYERIMLKSINRKNEENKQYYHELVAAASVALLQERFFHSLYLLVLKLASLKHQAPVERKVLVGL